MILVFWGGVSASSTCTFFHVNGEGGRQCKDTSNSKRMTAKSRTAGVAEYAWHGVEALVHLIGIMLFYSHFYYCSVGTVG